MTITLDLPPDVEASIRERAAARGQEPADYLRELAERDALPQAPPAWLAELKPEDGRNGMAELFGKWPGDSEEGLEEELRALREGKQRDLVTTNRKTNG